MAAQQQVQIFIECAADLCPSDTDGKADPYVKFWWQGKKYKTKVISNSLSPTWNETFPLNYKPGEDANILSLEIYDKDRLNRNDPLGKVDLDLNKLQKSESNSESWYPLDRLNGSGRGQIRVKVVFLDSSGKEIVSNTAEENIKRILPKAKREKIKAALKEFDGDEDLALNHLISQQVSTAVLEFSNQAAAQIAHPPLGTCGQNLKPEVYAANYSPKVSGSPCAGLQASLGGDVLGLKRAEQVIQDPNVVYAGQGRKKALLIGVNYLKSRGPLKGCIQDAHRMKQVLVGIYQFPDIPGAIVMLTDDNPDPRFQPTRKNIVYAMKWLVQDARAGDVFFFHFAGKGAQIPNKNGTEEDGMDEAIFPCDYDSAGAIIDDEMQKILVQPLPSGARLTAVLDCSHSGTGLDLPFIWDSKRMSWEEEFSPYFAEGDVQLFSACTDEQVAADQKVQSPMSNTTETGGVMTIAFITALAANPWGHTYPSLLEALRVYIKARGFKKQQPQLTSNQKFSVNRQFNLTDIVPNYNEFVGRPFKKNRGKQSTTLDPVQN